LTLWASDDAYEPYIGRWSRPVARAFVSWLGVPQGSCWLDVGCGTGALSEALLAGVAPRALTGLDAAAAYVRSARARLGAGRATLVVGDGGRLPFDPGRFDAAVGGLVLNFLPQPASAVAEWARATRPGGTVAAYVWDYAAGMGLIRAFWDVAGDLDPAARALDEGARFPLCRPEPLRHLFRDAALEAVEVQAIDVPTVFRDFADYWSPFLGGQGPAPAYAVALPEARRDALRDRLRARLLISADGAIRLTARAWGVRGTVPG
jgi:SAM-dependent methyltransferase